MADEREIVKADIREKKHASLDTIIKDAEKIPLSGEDLLRMTNHETKVMRYEELKHYDSLESVLQPHGSVILLYQTAEDFGHYSTLIDRGNRRLEFYDSYGFKPDEGLNHNNEFHLRIHGGRIVPHLHALIVSSGWLVEYNPVRLQKRLADENTCGRYAVLRIILKDDSLKTFNSLLTKNKHYDSDFWVSSLTIFL